MKRNLVTFLILIALVLAGVSLARSKRDGDIHIRLNNRQAEAIASTAEVDTVGDALYDTQEGAHDTLTDTTGIEVDYNYVWVCVGDECLPIDPLRFSN